MNRPHTPPHAPMRTKNFRTAILAALATLLGGFSTTAHAGGYLIIDGAGTPYKWDDSAPIVYNLDQGPLSPTIDNTSAATLVANAVGVWSGASIPTSNLSFSSGADLGSDHVFGASNPALGNVGDGVTPVIYDQDGQLTDSLLGAGQSSFVLGFAGPAGVLGTTIVEGQAILNGLFVDGLGSPTDVSVTQYTGVISHEIGHMLNLDHAQMNDSFRAAGIQGYTPNYSGFPTMYPNVHSGIDTPETDDKHWISYLYPSGSFPTGSISGVIRDNAGNPLNGVNVIARRADGAVTEAISCVTGYVDPSPATTPDGVYFIPGLDPGTRWVVDFEQIRPNFTGGSSVGPIDPPLPVPGSVEFANEAGIESVSDPVQDSTSFTVPAVGGLTSVDIDLGFPLATLVVTESDPGSAPAFPGEAQQITNLSQNSTVQIIGSITSTEGGDFNVLGDIIEDWYEIVTPAGLELNKIVLSPFGSDLDLYIASYDGISTITFPANSRQTGTSPEIINTNLDSALFNNRRVFIGVSSRNGQPADTYTLTLNASNSDSDAVVIGNIVGGVPGALTITGRGFKDGGNLPTVVFDDPDIVVGAITVVNPSLMTVSTTVTGAITQPVTTLVRNAAANGSYAGRLTQNITINSTTDLTVDDVVDGADPVVAGTNVTYSISVTNNGPDGVPDAQVSFPIPAGTTYVSDTSGGSYAPGTAIWTIGSLTPGSTVGLSVSVNVDSSRTTNLAATATVSSSIPDSVPGNDAASEATAVTTEANLRLVKGSVGSAFAGGPLNYVLTVDNLGPSDALGVSVTDILPAGYVFSGSSSASGSYTSGTGIWDGFNVVAGTAETLNISGSVASSYLGATIDNGATVTSITPLNPASQLSDNDIATITRSADRSITAVPSFTTRYAGEALSYLVTVTNPGPSDSDSISVTALLPPEVTFSSALPSVGSYASGTGIWDGFSVASGSSATLTISGTIPASLLTPATADLTATLDPSAIDANGANDSSSATTVNITSAADLQLTVGDSVDPLLEGNNLTYTLTVTNAGPSDVASYNMIGTLPSGVTFISADPPLTELAGVVSGSVAGPITPGSATSYNILVNVPVGLGVSSISFTPNVGNPGTELNGANNSETETTTINGPSDVNDWMILD